MTPALIRNGRADASRTEVEWEYAASLGLFDPDDPYSGVRAPDGCAARQYLDGPVPGDRYRPGRVRRCRRRSAAFRRAVTGAYDMIGNVWEWTDTPFSPSVPRLTIKGGSYLCSENYCRRFRAAAREDMEPDFSTAHIGFRIVRDVE